MKTHLLFTGLLTTVSLLSYSNFAAAQYPTFSGEMVIELQNEYAADSDDQDVDGYNQLFLRSEVAPVLHFNEHFYLDGVAVLEPVQDFDAADDSFFEEEGVFIEEIKLNFEHGPWGLFAGKFNPGFGIAWDYGRGIWGEDFAEDYEITEKIGAGASYTLETPNFGAHTFTASSFFADTTFLSESIGTSRGTTTKSDGGVSNTEDFSSYVFSLEGENLAGVENLYYKLGYRHQAEGDADTGGNDENGYVMTLGHVFDVTERVNADLLLEYADIHSFEAGNDDNRYATASLITTFDEKWNVTIAYTDRDTNVNGGGDIDDHLLQISGGYDFGQGTTFEVGWKNTQEDSTDTDIIGALVRHSFEF